jgi:hypothetical protein
MPEDEKTRRGTVRWISDGFQRTFATITSTAITTSLTGNSPDEIEPAAHRYSRGFAAGAVCAARLDAAIDSSVGAGLCAPFGSVATGSLGEFMRRPGS